MSTTRQIISGSLRPNINTNLGDDFYAPEFRQLQDAVEVYVPYYKMDFPAYEFNYKVKYYRKLIDNNVIETLNAAFHECFNASAPRIAFKLMQMRRTIRGNVEELDKMIRQNGYELDQLLADNVNFKDAINRKECAFIFNYLQLSLIRLFLEFQYHYSDQIDDSKIMTCEDFYLQVLGVRPPTPPIIAEIIRETPPPKQKKLGGRAVGKKGFWLDSSFKTMGGAFLTSLCLGLERGGFIKSTQTVSEFKECFAGKQIKTKLVWTGGKSMLSYFVKMLYEAAPIRDEGSKWVAACNCFTDTDGTTFDPTNLKDQKKPKIGTDAIDDIIKEAIDACRA